MAKILSATETTLMVWGRVAGLGALFGIVLWLVSMALSQFVIEPLTCGIGGGAGQCSQALAVSSNVASVLMGAGAIFAGIWLRIARPLFVAISATLMLWQLASWVSGLFWLEALGWSALVGALAYLLFGWINRTQSIAVTIIVTVVIIVAEHVVLAL